MKPRYVSSFLWLVLALVLQSRVLALSPAQLQSIHAAAIATGDQAAVDAFELLKAEGILDAESGPAEDVLKELSFKVLDVNQEEVTAAFMLLRRQGVFDDVENEKPPGPPQLTPTQRAHMESASRYLNDMRSVMHRLDPLVAEFNKSWTGFGQRKALRQMESVLSSAKAYFDRAQRSLRQLRDIEHPEVTRLQVHAGEVIGHFNSWVRWVNKIWRQFERM